MTRPKVPEDKRQRTAQACDTCKRRKQKCNGLKPCNTCTKRSLTCSYASGNSPEDGHTDISASPTKRRHIEDNSTLGDSAPPLTSPAAASSVPWDPKPRQGSTTGRPTVEFDVKPSVEQDHDSVIQADHEYDSRSRHSTASGPDEETSLLQSTRMLQDPTGRLLYVGDSASLSYLQLIRMIVEARTGPNTFTLDPSRHKIMENTIIMPTHIRPPHILPDRATADILVESFFTNTQGLCQIFSRRAFEKAVEATYTDPLTVDSSFLCLLYLTFAIGMVLATPILGTREDIVLKKLRSDQFDRAELFFRSAKALGDPVSGFEDADFWSVQALSLMAVYMLAVSKRNAAYAYFGMAVRSAFALGLHRVSETHFIFKSDEVKLRRNLWRSLFVLDRFLAASLGRPVAIAEDECSDDALIVFEKNADGDLVPTPDPTGGLDAAVRSCQVIGQILKKIYARRRISIRLSQEIADQCRAWSSSLHPDLHWRRVLTTPANAASGIAALHVNLLYCHSILLLTRPFFICLLSKVHNERSGHTLPVPRWINRMGKYCEACLNASNHTIALVQMAHESSYLPQRNPFVLYFLFAASLIVLSNEFASIYPNPSYNTSINNTIAIMHYCAETDPQAARLLYILTSFRSAVFDVNQHSKNPPAMPAPLTLSPTNLNDPMVGLFMPGFGSASRKNSFAGATAHTPTTLKATMAPPPLSVKHESNFPGNGVSPASSTAGLSHSIGDLSGRAVNEPDTTDSLGGEAELDFDSLWTWPSVVTAPAPGVTGPDGGGHGFPPGPVSGPRYDAYAGFAGPSGTGGNGGGNGNGNGNGFSMAANVPMYAPSEFS